MKLVDLKARFYGRDERMGLGVVFECPCAKCQASEAKGELGRLIVIPFANPIDGGAADHGGNGWQRTGETLETLTLSPSILRCDGCKWHGWIRNGEAVTS